jgi:hypothetical protein
MSLDTRRNVFLVLCIVIAAVLIARHFHGPKQETWSVPIGNALAIVTPCANAVSITADPTLHRQMDILATADSKQQISELQTRSGAATTLSGAGSHCLGQSACTESSAICAGLPNPASLKLALTVPAAIAIAITEAQGTDYDIGDIGGALTLDLSGSGDVNAASATSLNAALTGGGDAHIASVTGPIQATLSKSGDLDIANAAAPSTNLTLNGDGDVNIAAGNLGALTATLSHDGDLHAPDAASAALQLTADGDAELDNIAGNLAATLTGDGDLSVQNVAGDANISSSADGDVTIPHVAGHLTQNNTGDGDFKINGG